MDGNFMMLALDPAILKNIALLVFFGLWIGIVLRLIVSRSTAYREAARLPLAEDAALKGDGHDG
jgi:hypothetical protein